MTYQLIRGDMVGKLKLHGRLQSYNQKIWQITGGKKAPLVPRSAFCRR
jgi:hypothetical protein